MATNQILIIKAPHFLQTECLSDRVSCDCLYENRIRTDYLVKNINGNWATASTHFNV